MIEYQFNPKIQDSYAIHEFEADGLLRFAEKINGSYIFRAGMPVDKLVEFLRANDADVYSRNHNKLDYVIAPV